MIVLGCMDIDYALRFDRPAALTSESTEVVKSAYEKWERSNRISLMIMQHSIPESIKGGISDEQNAKGFLKQIADQFTANEKVETSTILTKLVSMRYKGKGSIREYIMEMSNLVTRLKGLKLEMSVDILVHLVLISLPAQYNQFKISYNTQKEKWNLNELIAQCVQEEERLKQDKAESALLTVHTEPKNKRKRNKKTADPETSQHKEQKKQGTGFTCFFCKKAGHLKKDCSKYAAWRMKKGELLNFVCSEVNLALVPSDTWWIDSGATTHISVTMQDCLRSRMPIDGERYIYVGNGNRAAVEAIGVFRIPLCTGMYLDLEETFVVPSFRRNLISISSLDLSGYSSSFRNGKFSISLNSNVIGTGTLVGKLYKLDTTTFIDNEGLFSSNLGTKRRLTNENTAIIWPKRLGHISKQRIQRLMSEGIIDSLDLSDLKVCIECVKGKQTNKRKTGAYRSSELLELIHMDICGPFPKASWNGQQYFISFIDDYSRYVYLYLIHEKSQSLDMFKHFKAEVENQLGKKIKAVRSDRGGEYYGRYDGSGEQCPGPFAHI